MDTIRIPVKALQVNDIVLDGYGKPSGTILGYGEACTWNKIHFRTSAGNWCFDHQAIVSVKRKETVSV